MNSPYMMGWHRDLPDNRDFLPSHPEIAEMLGRSSENKPAEFHVQFVEPNPSALPASCDLTRWCSEVEDQESLGSCTAHAGVGLVEYYERRALGQHMDASRLFLYKTTRDLLGWTGDTGAYLRTTMKAMALFGVPPEVYQPYVVSKFDEEPSAFCYAYGQNLQALRYFRLDAPNLKGDEVLAQVKRFLAAGFPSMFGFTVYDSISEAADIPYPEPGESVLGGHAVVAVGYDDNHSIRGRKGALRIRNSWGLGWGDDGYGWLPYDYVRDGLAVDFWSLLRKEYDGQGRVVWPAQSEHRPTQPER